MKELWHDGVVYGETVMFAGSRTGKLMFPAEKIIRVENPCTGKVYIEGKDFCYTPGSAEITLPDFSAVPCFSESDIHPSGSVVRLRPDPCANAIEGAVDGGFLMFTESGWFAENQVDVTYRAANIDVDFLPYNERIPHLRKMLAGGENIRITLIGDSISVGCNSTKFMQKTPFEPFYMERICDFLTEKYGSAVTLKNRAIGGTGILQAENIKKEYHADHADLLAIAYGMNNFARTPVAEFLAELQKIIDENRQVNPACEYLIISPMSGNPLWKATEPGNDFIYAEKLREFAANAPEDIIFADVNKVWQIFMKRKGFYSLTGNGVNHPNDYGHRIYAAVLQTLF